MSLNTGYKRVSLSSMWTPTTNHRVDGRHILGLAAPFKVLYRNSRGVEIGLAGGHQKGHALTDSSSRALLHAGPRRRLLASAASKYKYEEIDGFLRLPSRRGHREQEDYRSITKQNPDLNSDSDSSASGESPESESSGYDSDYTPFSSLQLTLKDLEQKIKSDPTSVSTWLAIVSHSLSTIPSNSKNAPKAIAEIGTAILKRALDAHQSNRKSATLWLRYLSAGEEIWTAAELQGEWEEALKLVEKPQIWFEWFAWRARGAERGLDGVAEDGERALKAICTKDDDATRLKIFWLAAITFQNAGVVFYQSLPTIAEPVF